MLYDNNKVFSFHCGFRWTQWDRTKRTIKEKRKRWRILKKISKRKMKMALESANNAVLRSINISLESHFTSFRSFFLIRSKAAFHRCYIKNMFRKISQNSQKNTYQSFFNPFVPNAPFLYPLKTSENLMVFLYFQGVEKWCIGNEWVKVAGCGDDKRRNVPYNANRGPIYKPISYQDPPFISMLLLQHTGKLWNKEEHWS